MSNKGKTRLYKAKTTDANLFAEHGWDLMPIQVSNGHIMVFKWVKLDFDSEPVQGLIKAYEKYADKYSGSILSYLNELDIGFVGAIDDSTGKPRKTLRLTDKAMETLTAWRLEVDLDEDPHAIRLHPNDFTFPNPIWPYKWIRPAIKGALDKEIEDGIVGTCYLGDE